MSVNEVHAHNGAGSEVKISNGSLGLDTVFGILKESRRRHAIQTVLEHERIRQGELTDRVSELEYRRPIEDIDKSSERHTIYVSLHQSHLPKLEQHGVIEWDRDGDIITIGENATQLEWVLSRLESDGTLSDKLKRSFAALC